MKYRKRPVVIDAFQMSKRSAYDFTSWPGWLLNHLHPQNLHKNSIHIIMSPDGIRTIQITTLEGTLHVTHDDWIIKGESGEIYPCKPDIFELTYEKVEQ